jgi:hypothetical protein
MTTQTTTQEAGMTTLYFTKQFTGGSLRGLTINESMQFASTDAAAEFIKFGRKGCRKPVAGGSPWKIVDASFQKYWRY